MGVGRASGPWSFLVGAVFLVGSQPAPGHGQPRPPVQPIVASPGTAEPAGSTFDLAGLDEAQQQLFWRVAKGELCPCGQPTSFARCLNQPQVCPRALALARDLQSWIKAGAEYRQAADQLLSALEQLARVKSIELIGVACLGPHQAPIKLVSYSDFECPFCRKAARLAHELQRQSNGTVAYCFKHFPLSYHLNASYAATVAELLNDRGLFWKYHDQIFAAAEQGLTEEKINAIAAKLGVKLEREEAALQAAAARVAKHTREGRDNQLSGTPSFFVNGRSVTSEEPLEVALPRLIAEELQRLGLQPSTP